MLNIISAELFKAFRKKRFWFLVVIFGLLVPLIQFLIALFTKDRISGGLISLNNEVGQAINDLASPFILANNNLGIVFSNILLPLTALFAVFLVSEERGWKMWKVILTTNSDRLKIIIGKFMTVMILLGLILLSGLVGSVIFGTFSLLIGLTNTFSGDWLTLLSLYGLQWLALSAPVALGFLISWLINSPALTMVIVIIVPGALEMIIRFALIQLNLQKITIFNLQNQAQQTIDVLETAQRYFFTSNINLASRFTIQGSEFFSSGNEIPAFLSQFSWNSTFWSLGICAVYFALFFGLLIWSFSTRDIHE